MFKYTQKKRIRNIFLEIFQGTFLTRNKIIFLINIMLKMHFAEIYNAYSNKVNEGTTLLKYRKKS